MTPAQATTLKEKFLLAFADLGNVKTACQKSGIKRRQTVYDWRAEDEDFEAAWLQAEILATETLEAEAWRRAVKGVRNEKAVFWQGAEVGRHVETEYSDTLLVFLLKARAPEKYRERSDVNVTATVEDASGLSDEQRAERIAGVLDRIRSRAAGPVEPGRADLGAAARTADGGVA